MKNDSMNFINFYKMNSKHHRWFRMEDLPEETKADLIKLLSENDRRIGYFVYHSHGWNDDHTEVIFKGMEIGYYVRSWHPRFVYGECFIFGHLIEYPAGLTFWMMKRAYGA